jgi:hypothetical protein
MSRYAKYVDSGNYLPGEIRRASVSRYDMDPLDAAEAMRKLQWDDFKLADDVKAPMDTTAFKTYLSIQADPSMLFRAGVASTFPKQLTKMNIPGVFSGTDAFLNMYS